MAQPSAPKEQQAQTSEDRLARLQTRPPWLINALLWLIVLALQLALLVAVRGLPWLSQLTWWTMPGAVGTGIGIGLLLTLATLPRRWWSVLMLGLLLGAAVGAGGVLAARGTRGPHLTVGTLATGAYATTLSALLPWLVFRGRQAWGAAGLVWLTVAGTLGAQTLIGGLSGEQQRYWLGGLLALSCLLLGLSTLREEIVIWQKERLHRVGPVTRHTMQAICLIGILGAAIGLLPLEALRWQTLQQLYQNSPLAQSGPLTYNSAAGKPISTPGAPLALDTPGVTGNASVLSYTILGGTPGETPLLAATFDSFDGATWTQNAASQVVSVSGRLAFPPAADLLKARITLELDTTNEVTPLLLGFSQPVEFSLPASARLLTGGDATALTVASWQSPRPLTKGTTYTDVSAVLSLHAQPTGELPADLLALMTAVPASLQATLVAQAKSWVGDAQTSAERAMALYTAMRQNFRFDASAVPPQNVDGISWFLQHKRGDGLLWASTYVLLGRALGLPMRLAEGYLPGTYDNTRHAIVVRESDAAVWAQLAVPGAGWVDVFPAASLRVIKALPKTDKTPVPFSTTSPVHSSTPTLPWLPDLRKAPGGTIAGITIAVLVAVLLAALLLITVRWIRLGHGSEPVARFFARIAALARLAGIELRASDTAQRGTAKVAAHLPEQQAQVLGRLNTIYEVVTYGPPPRRAARQHTAQEHWRMLRNSLVRLVLKRPWRRGRSNTGARGQKKEG